MWIVLFCNFICIFFLMRFLHSVRFPAMQLICSYTNGTYCVFSIGASNNGIEHRYAYENRRKHAFIEWMNKAATNEEMKSGWNGIWKNKEMNATSHIRIKEKNTHGIGMYIYRLFLSQSLVLSTNSTLMTAVFRFLFLQYTVTTESKLM